MGNGPNVITLLDRFTFCSELGAPVMYTPWEEVPTWCRQADALFECFAFNSGPMDMVLQVSMDKVSGIDLVTEFVDSPKTVQTNLTKGLARYARMKLKAKGTGIVNMVISAHLLLRSAE